jgi:hypothetical protein
MYQINYCDKDGSDLRANVTIYLDAKTPVVCTVPVFAPKTKDDVIRAVEEREKAEIVQFEASPILDEIIGSLAVSHTGKMSTGIKGK